MAVEQLEWVPVQAASTAYPEGRTVAYRAQLGSGDWYADVWPVGRRWRWGCYGTGAKSGEWKAYEGQPVWSRGAAERAVMTWCGVLP